MSKFHKGVAIVLGLLFILFALFQYNDPDPAQWMAVYFVAAALSFGVATRRTYRPLFLLLALAAFIGAYFFWPDSYHGVALDDNFKYEVEHARESLGLVILGLTMLYYYFISK